MFLAGSGVVWCGFPFANDVDETGLDGLRSSVVEGVLCSSQEVEEVNTSCRKVLD